MRNLKFILIFLFIFNFNPKVKMPTYQGIVEDYNDILDKETINSVLFICDSLKIGMPDLIKSNICVRGNGFNAYCIQITKKIELDSISFERRRLRIYVSGNQWAQYKYDNLQSTKIERGDLFTDRNNLGIDTLYTFKNGIYEYTFHIGEVDYKTAIKIIEAFLGLRNETNDPIANLKYLTAIDKSYTKAKDHYMLNFSYGDNGSLYIVKFKDEKIYIIETKDWII